MEELKTLKSELASMTEELQVLAENDPAIIDAMRTPSQPFWNSIVLIPFI